MAPRVRIAPSPTGDPHVGTAYVALFNYAFARHHGGTFVLRIEDTDAARSTASSEAAIYDELRWTGLTWDEGPDVGGPYAPYRQSERAPLYQEHAAKLVASGHAYRCFCTRDRLSALKAEQEAAKQANTGYDRLCRALDPEESTRRAEAGEAHTVRLAVPLSGETTYVDALRGEISIAHATVDDQVLLKSDGNATYHLANVVDDHLMKISHVIRGEDWLTSTPKHVLLYAAFGWEQPVWCHVGLLRNMDGTKLSKRKNPVSINYYRDMGYMAPTFLNFLGTLGYSMPDERERFTLDEFVADFDTSRMRTGGPKFDIVKLRSFNADDIRAMTPDALREAVMARLTDARLTTLLDLSRERIDTLEDFIPYNSFFFGGSVDYTAVAPKLRLKKRTPKASAKILVAWSEGIERDPAARSFTVEALETFSREFCAQVEWKPKEVFMLLRLGATGRLASPPLFDTLAALGKDRVRERLRDAVQFLRAMPEQA